MASRRARRILPLSPSRSAASTLWPRSSRKTVMSMSSENREMSPKAFDREVPPLNSSRGPPAGRPLNSASRVQQTQKSFSTFCPTAVQGAPQRQGKDPVARHLRPRSQLGSRRSSCLPDRSLRVRTFRTSTGLRLFEPSGDRGFWIASRQFANEALHPGRQRT